MAKQRVRRRRRREVSTRVRQVWETVTTALALLTGIYLILTTIDPTRAVLERYLDQLNMQGIVALVGIMLEIATIAVYQLGREVRALRSELVGRIASETVYSAGDVMTRIREMPSGRRQHQVEILGLTLNTTWPSLSTWLTTQGGTNWNITLYCLDPDFIESCTELPNEWANESRGSLDRIDRFLQGERDNLKKRRIAIEVNVYACVPIVHGFRFRDETLYVSYLQWNDDNRIRPFDFYDQVPSVDSSTRARHYRDLFDSWLARAAACRVDAGGQRRRADR